MSSHEEDGTVSSFDTPEWSPSHAIFMRYAVRRRGGLAAVLIIGFTAGIAYRLLMDPAGERDLANYLRSGFHGAGLGLAVWAVQTAFAASARSSFGAALRRLPVGGEILIRSLAMTAVLVSVGVFLQFVLYTEPLGLRWFTADWLLARRRAAWRRRVWHDLAEDRRHWVRHLARMLTLLVTLTTSMTSLWTVLVILSSFLLRVFGTLDIFMQFIRWLFDVDAHPVRVIGLVAAFIVWLASTLYSWL